MSTSTDLMTMLAWSLLHFLWQGAAIAALAAAAMQVFRESTTRYLIGITALALMCVSFGVTFALLTDAPAVGTKIAADASAVGDVAPVAVAGTVTLLLDRPAAPLSDLGWVARGWLAIVCLLALRVAWGLLLLEHLRRRSLSALPTEIVERCLALQRRLGISRVVRYCECRLVDVPSVIGFFRPIVLLPLRALTGLSAEQLEVVIAHELAHIKRFDVAVNLLQVLVETLFFFHPAVWWLNRRIRADREDCCDDIAVAACGSRVSYVRALAIMSEWRDTLQLSTAITGGDVASRVARLLDMSRQPAGVRSAGVFTPALVLAAALIAGATSIGIAGQIVEQVEPLAELEQLEPLAELEQLEPLAELAQLEPLAELAQLEPLAELERLEPLAELERLEPLAELEQLEPLAELAQLAPLAELAQLAPLAELAQLEPLAQARPENPARPDTARAPADAQRGASYIDQMKAAGLDVTDVDLLIALKAQDVSADYVREIRDAGFDPDADEVIAMKVHGVTTEDIERARALDPDAGLDEVLAMKIHGVTAQDVEQARALGFDADLDDVLAMKVHGVTAADIERARALGPDADIDDVLAMKVHGVTAEDIEQARALGLDADLDDVLAMKIHGVTPEDVRQFRDMGLELDADDVIALKIYEITPEFVNEARSLGFEDLSVDQIIQLKNADVL